MVNQNVNKTTVDLQELLISNLAQTDAIADLLVEKGLMTRDEILEKIGAQRETAPTASPASPAPSEQEGGRKRKHQIRSAFPTASVVESADALVEGLVPEITCGFKSRSSH